MNTYKKISIAVNEHMFLFCSKIVEENPNISLEDLLKEWCEIENTDFEETFGQYIKLSSKQKKISSKNSQKSEEIETISTTSKDYNKIDSEDSSEEIDDNIKQNKKPIKTTEKQSCIYVFQKGTKMGQKCNSIAKNSSYCSKHTKL